MNLFKSKVGLTIIGTFVFAGLGAISGLVPANYASYITIVLTLLGGYLHSGQIARAALSSRMWGWSQVDSPNYD